MTGVCFSNMVPKKASAGGSIIHSFVPGEVFKLQRMGKPYSDHRKEFVRGRVK